MSEPMTDERLEWLAKTGGCDFCDSNWTECIWEIRRLRVENEQPKADWNEIGKEAEIQLKSACKIIQYIQQLEMKLAAHEEAMRGLLHAYDNDEWFNDKAADAVRARLEEKNEAGI